MGLATLSVWIHDKVDPCKISDEGGLVAVPSSNGAVRSTGSWTRSAAIRRSNFHPAATSYSHRNLCPWATSPYL